MLRPRLCAALAVLCWLGVAAAIPPQQDRVLLPRGTDPPMVEAVTLHEALCPGLCSSRVPLPLARWRG